MKQASQDPQEHGRAAERWRAVLRSLRTWNRRGVRAVHKPLLSLLLIARAERGEPRTLAFRDVAEPLVRLLRQFGPPRKSYHPEFPFWHLQSDGIWQIDDAAALPRKKGGGSPTRKTLEERDVCGAVPERLWQALAADAQLRAELIRLLLDQFWPPTLHAGIRRAIGLPDEATAVREAPASAPRRPRDPRFRDEVLRAYERQCAVCGYDGRLADAPFALEAAHIRWWAYDGPDRIDNALALCSLHHVALDCGAVGVAPDLRVLIAADVTAGAVVEQVLLRYAGASLRPPQPGYPTPHAGFLDWHRREVFHGPARLRALSPLEGLGRAAEASDHTARRRQP